MYGKQRGNKYKWLLMGLRAADGSREQKICANIETRSDGKTNVTLEKAKRKVSTHPLTIPLTQRQREMTLGEVAPCTG